MGFTQDLQDRLESLERVVARSGSGPRPLDLLIQAVESREPHDFGSRQNTVDAETLGSFDRLTSVGSDADGIQTLCAQATNDADFLVTISASTHNTLLNNFWTYYNCELQCINRTSFERGWRAKDLETYSPFLHLCILGIGLRYCDSTDADIAPFFLLPGQQSVFHQRAIQTAKIAVEEDIHTCLIQALVLFGDLEFGAGRNNSGWMHASKLLPLATCKY